MAPTTGRSASGAALAVGSPGADRITTALMQVLGRGLLRGDDLQHSIDAPRLHVRFMDDGSPRVEHEPSDDIAAAVEAQRPAVAPLSRARTCTSAGWARPCSVPDGLVAAGRRET